jgi:hypothetical protein
VHYLGDVERPEEERDRRRDREIRESGYQGTRKSWDKEIGK